MLTNLSFNNICNKNINFGSGKQLPNELFHLTTTRNWDSIQKSGKLIPYKDELSDFKGIFFFDMKDFVHNWTKGDYNYAYELIKLLFGKSNLQNLVLLKVNLSNLLLAGNKFLLRSLDDIQQKSKTALIGVTIKEAKDNPLYREKVEYIFTNDIPIDYIKHVGERPFNDFNDLVGKFLKYDETTGHIKTVNKFMKLFTKQKRDGT